MRVHGGCDFAGASQESAWAGGEIPPDADPGLDLDLLRDCGLLGSDWREGDTGDDADGRDASTSSGFLAALDEVGEGTTTSSSGGSYAGSTARSSSHQLLPAVSSLDLPAAPSPDTLRARSSTDSITPMAATPSTRTLRSNRKTPPLRPVVYSSTGVPYRKRVSEMTAEELERIRESNRIMARRNREKNKAFRDALKQRLGSLTESNLQLRQTANVYRERVAQLKELVARHCIAGDAVGLAILRMLGCFVDPPRGMSMSPLDSGTHDQA